MYTKRWVVDLMLDAVGYVPGNGLVSKTIVEPSCGQGAFLVPIVDRLVEEFLGMWTGADGDWLSLSGCVRAYDIDPGSIEECRRLVLESLGSRGCPSGIGEALASSWLSCCDFLLWPDVPVADFVVGNPPYVRAVDIPRAQRMEYRSRLSCMTMGCDLYVGFIDRGLDCLGDGGGLCFICADRWLQNAYGERLRRRVDAGFDLSLLIRMHGVGAFDDEVDAYPAIMLIGPGHGDTLRFADCGAGFSDSDIDALRDWTMGRIPVDIDVPGRLEGCVLPKPSHGGLFPLGSPGAVGFVSRAVSRFPGIEDSGVSIGIGIATGCDSVFITEDPGLVEASRLMPLFYMRDYRRGRANRRRYLVNPWDDDGNLIDLADFPRTRDYFMRNHDVLARRHVARRNEAAWYRTIDKPRSGLLDRDLLLLPDMALRPDPVLSHGMYPHHNCYWLASDEWDLRVLGGLLMSDAVRDFVGTFGVRMRGGTLRFQAQYLRLLHVPPYSHIATSTRDRLRAAFDTGDRRMASDAAEDAYGER